MERFWIFSTHEAAGGAVAGQRTSRAPLGSDECDDDITDARFTRRPTGSAGLDCSGRGLGSGLELAFGWH